MSKDSQQNKCTCECQQELSKFKLEIISLKKFFNEEIDNVKRQCSMLMSEQSKSPINNNDDDRLIQHLLEENKNKNEVIKLLAGNFSQNVNKFKNTDSLHNAHKKLLKLTMKNQNHSGESLNNTNTVEDFNTVENVDKIHQSRSPTKPSLKTPTQRREEIKTNNIHKNTSLKTVPGNTSYSRITNHGKNIVISGDSIISNIKKKEFNKHVKSFSGATTADMDVYFNIISVLP